MSRLALCLLDLPRVGVGGEPVHISRSDDHGAYPDGTALRFESFRLWGR